MENFEKVIEACVGKLNKEDPYYSLSWGEIVDCLDMDYHPDNLRKGAYFVKRYHDYLQGKNIENMSSDEVEKLNEKIVELKKERVKSQDITNMLNKKIREQSRFEQMLECARDVASTFEKDKPLLSNVPVLRSGNKEAVVLLSDLHVGIINNNYWNKYNSDIAKYRMSVFKQRIIDICLNNNVKTIRLLCLGDLISGLIHNNLRLENREDVVEQSILVSEMISELMTSLSTLFEIEFYYVVGNHERISQNKSDSLDRENFGYFILEMIKQRCRNLKGLNINKNIIDDEIISFNIFNKRVVATHGNNFGSLPTYVSKLTTMCGYIPDFVCVGHFHQHIENTFGETELIVNPSFSGVDTYAKNKGLIGRPAQKVLLFSEEYGKEATYTINL